jgi:hypothetical protein
MIRFRVRGRKHFYVFHVHLRPWPWRSYVGAIYWCNEPRPGEDWLRGGDLRDGRAWAFPAVIWDVLCHEFGWGRWRQTVSI